MVRIGNLDNNLVEGGCLTEFAYDNVYQYGAFHMSTCTLHFKEFHEIPVAWHTGMTHYL